MRRAGAVHDDGAGPALAEVEAAGPERGEERRAVVACPPGRKRRRAQVVKADAGPFLNEALLRAERRDWTLGVERAGGDEPVCDVRAALPAKGRLDQARVLGRDRGRAVLELDDAGNLLSPGEIVPQVDDAAVGADEAVDPVLVPAVVLEMFGAAVGLLPEAKLALEKLPPPPPGPRVVRDGVLGIAVAMVDGLGGPAPEGHGDELADLALQVG
ncbi:hypothetical protein GGR33_004845 [Methylobacterium brachythecii]|uniref:Uncharacterized protein n=1 Tax=Methylobacterium brachythecii TaxID=1176177 RepID=A0A7W6ASS6_9HYPH|nr:hypothetical protein [Methylobacterium brachythecii]MBB3905312.1 hypothetical protein [Methylobacterium brachythecii]